MLLVCASAIFEHRSTRAIVAFALVTAVASWLALLAAGFNYAASYGCFS